MHGSITGLRLGYWLIFLGFFGCNSAIADPDEVQEKPKLVSQFEPNQAGTIAGQVSWQGEIPVVAPFRVHANLPLGNVPQPLHLEPNPNAPQIDRQSRAIDNAVIFLQNMDLARAKPWDLELVRVEMRNRHFQLFQGRKSARFAFVQRGSAINMCSRDSFFYSLRASGAAFFSLMFPDAEQPLRRRLQQAGMVELASGAGHFWMRAYLFVADHPYYTLTDAKGRFTLDKIPAGKYQLVCWMPDWHKDRHERDPETGLISRLFFTAPKQWSQSVTVKVGKTSRVSFVARNSAFGKK